MKKVFSFFMSIVIILSVTAIFGSAEGEPAQASPVEIKGKSAILMDVDTGEVLIEYNADEKLYPASVTKIMTMLLVCEAIDQKKISLSDKVSCTANAASKGGSQIWLEEGEVMTVEELLKATAVGSANDAATLLGEYVSGSEGAFVSLMNVRAKELGMVNTCFENPTGLDDTSETHLTTARDIAIMSRELLKHELILKYTCIWMDSLRDGKTELVNTNKLVRFYKGTTGLKTGTTSKAGCCVSASAKRDNLHLVAVVMGSENSNDRFETAKALLNYGFSNYCLVSPKINTESLSKISVSGGKKDYCITEVPEIAPVLLKKGEESKLKINASLDSDIVAPVEKNQVLGEITVELEGEVLAVYKIKAKESVMELTIWDCIKRVCTYFAKSA